MSSKLIKHQPNLIIDPNDQVIVDLKIYKSGMTQLQAPYVQPTELCKLLYGIITDVTYAALQQQQQQPEKSKIETV